MNIKQIAGGLLILAIFILGGEMATRTNAGMLGGGIYQTPILVSASTTAYTISNTSTRILATSTPTKRVAASIATVNCTTGLSMVNLKLNNDIAATANTGLPVYATSTVNLSDYPMGPLVVQGSVQAIANTGTCTVLVTEWRAQNQ